MTLRDRAVDLLARLPLVSSRHARAVLVVYLVISLVMMAGVSMLQFDDNVQNILPRGDPNTLAAQNVSREFPTNYYITAVNLVIDPSKYDAAAKNIPNRVTQANKTNITDEVYIRGIYEFNKFFLAHVPSASYNVTLDSYVRLINYTNTGRCVNTGAGGLPTTCASKPDPRAFRYLPPTTSQGEQEYYQDWQTMWTASPQTVEAIVGPGWNTTRNIFLFQPAPGQTTKDVGNQIIAGWNAYKAWAPEHAKYDVFDLQHSWPDSGQPTVLDAHTSDLTSHDVELLAPIVVAFILAALYIAFRNVESIVIAGSTLLLGALWSFGVMGFARIPLNTLNIALVPLILGNGIDYAIHVINEFLEHKQQGLPDHEALELTGRGAGVALFIASTTTVCGLLIMAVSPSILMAEVGVVSALGMAIVFLLSMTFIPAALTVAGTDRLSTVFRPSRLVPRLARGVARQRILVIVLVLALTLGAYVSAQNVSITTYGDPATNFPPGDWARKAQQDENLYLFGSTKAHENWATNFLVFEGDITDPAFHAYLRNLTVALKNTSSVRSNSVVGLDYVIEQWELLKGGTTGAVVPIAREQAQPGSTYPTTRQGIQQDIREIFHSPLSTYGAMFVNYPKDNMTLTALEIGQGSTYAQTSHAWDNVWSVIHGVGADPNHPLPKDVRVHMYGFTATSYLFVHDELPWVQIMAAGAFVVVLALVAFFTRDLRAILTVGTLMALTSVWWFGLLPLFHIGVSIALMLPMVFIMSIGSDYAVHLTWTLKHTDGDAQHVFATTGKAVLFSAVTDGGAFAIFTAMQYLLMRRAMVATSLAIVAIFLCTMLVLPLFYRRELLGQGNEATAVDRKEAGAGAVGGPGEGVTAGTSVDA